MTLKDYWLQKNNNNVIWVYDIYQSKMDVHNCTNIGRRKWKYTILRFLHDAWSAVTSLEDNLNITLFTLGNPKKDRKQGYS